MKHQRRYIVISLFLLTLFVAYQASIMHFSHIHFINGVMIVHSHPSTDNQHTHTEGQALTLAHISHWSGVEPTDFALDEVIFEEFKGTGNMELQLDRTLSNKRIFPAVNIIASSTRRDDLLLDKQTLDRMWILRKHLADMTSLEAMEFVKEHLGKTKDNAEFLISMNG